uniref:ABC transporter ATP-binding protein n=1 Tax=Pararhizobium sp. IMCC3301 TaxID=3067904 RepID=UPI002740B5C4|nr:ABC transporter ATP-binding protein [Pararhizobium sp. IMCC3301]
MNQTTRPSGLKTALSWGRRGTAGATIAREMRFDNISHHYGPTRALHDINLTIASGEIVCLLGQSGSGKTTLLRIAAGIEAPQSGRFLVDGQEYGAPDRLVPPEKRGIGLMFQDFALFPHLTVLKNVMFGLTALSSSIARSEAMLALERVGLAQHADLYPHHLSGGEQQRVALARSIAPRPGILLMDEPFSGLDQRLRDSVRDETIAILREMRATCLMVTHDPEEAMRVADRILLMKHGQIVQDGSARELYYQPVDLASARFFSEVNMLEGEIVDEAVITPVGTFAAEGKSNGTASVCIRFQGVNIIPITNQPAPVGAKLGRVLRRRFLGEVDLVDTAVEGLDDPLQARIRNADNLKPGTEVFVSFDPRDILVFEKEEP